jgi:hypothetical protein
MKRPIESDYTSHVAYTRALEEYCDWLVQPVQEPVAWCIEYEVLISRTNIGSSLRKFKEHWAKCSFVSEDKNAEIEIENWRNRVEKPLIFADTTPPAQPAPVQQQKLERE